MELGEARGGAVVATRCERLIKTAGMEDDLSRCAGEAPKQAVVEACVFPWWQFACVIGGALGDGAAAFGALPCSGQAGEGIAATLAEDGTFVGDDYIAAGHCGMV